MRLQETPLWWDVMRRYPHLADKAKDATFSAYAGCYRYAWFRTLLTDANPQEPELVWDTFLGTVMTHLLADPALQDDAVYAERKYTIVQAAEREMSQTLRGQYVNRWNQPRRIEAEGLVGRTQYTWEDHDLDIEEFDDWDVAMDRLFPDLAEGDREILMAFAEAGSLRTAAAHLGIPYTRVRNTINRLRTQYTQEGHAFLLLSNK